jgi:hypothetical protein
MSIFIKEIVQMSSDRYGISIVEIQNIADTQWMEGIKLPEKLVNISQGEMNTCLKGKEEKTKSFNLD